MKTPTRTAKLALTALENREMMSISTWQFDACTGTLTAWTNDYATQVEVKSDSAGKVWMDDTSSYLPKDTPAYAGVRLLQFVGGTGNDRFVTHQPGIPVKAWGQRGNDYLEGYNADDFLYGGAGNDKLAGYGGNDQMWGQGDDDVLLGMTGNDTLYGGTENDRLNGGAGTDSMWGDDGNDTLVAVDDGVGDYVRGGAGADVVWLDKTATGAVDGIDWLIEDQFQFVASFRNGADRTLDGDDLGDPARLTTYTDEFGRTINTTHTPGTFANGPYTTTYPLFASAGPVAADINQGEVGDCWLMAGLGTIAQQSPNTLRQTVVDFDDGTYGVRLGDCIYRVDNDFPVTSSGSSTPAYAGFGAGNSVWVMVVEKAYAMHRSTYDSNRAANSYVGLDGGSSTEVFNAFGRSGATHVAFNSFADKTALANDIATRFESGQWQVLSITSPRSGPLPSYTGNHAFMVIGVRRVAGVVTEIQLRNPWNDSSITGGTTFWVTPDELWQYDGRVRRS